MDLTASLGDTWTFIIPMRWGKRPFVPGDDWHLVFTVKEEADDTVFAIQFESGDGISALGSYAKVEVPRSITDHLEPGVLLWDIQAERLDSDEVQTVGRGVLTMTRDITRARLSTVGSGNYVRDDDGTTILDDANSPLIYS